MPTPTDIKEFLGKINSENQNFYSIVTEDWYRCAVECPVDAFLCFTITLRRPIIEIPYYAEYQYFLYETISKLREKGMTFNDIAAHLTRKGFLG